MNYEDKKIMNDQINLVRNTEDREELIDNIEGLWPADSEYEDTARLGRQILEESRVEAKVGWRDEPVEVLRIYAEKCIRKDWEGVS